MAKRYKKQRAEGIGIGYLLKLTALISILMLANSYLVGRVVQSNVQMLPEILDDIRLYQFFQIFLPIVLVAVQFWIYDRIKDRRGVRGEG